MRGKDTRELELETAHALGYEAGDYRRDGMEDEYRRCLDSMNALRNAHYLRYGPEVSAEMARAWNAGYKLGLNRERRRA